MNVSYQCSACRAAQRVEVTAAGAALGCSACGHTLQLPADSLIDGQLRRCLACPSRDLFVRKDFPQRLGVLIVAVGIIGSSIAWAYTRPVLTLGILMATALVDVVLYWLVPSALMCYRCGAQYRWVEGMDRFGPFELETHERHRQQAARSGARPT